MLCAFHFYIYTVYCKRNSCKIIGFVWQILFGGKHDVVLPFCLNCQVFALFSFPFPTSIGSESLKSATTIHTPAPLSQVRQYFRNEYFLKFTGRNYYPDTVMGFANELLSPTIQEVPCISSKSRYTLNDHVQNKKIYLA